MNKTNIQKSKIAERKRRRQRIVRMQLLAIMATISFIVFLVYNKIHIKEQQEVKVEPTKELQQSYPQEKTTKKKEEGNKKLAKSKEAKKIWKNNKKLLILVNKENICPEDGLSLRKICNGRIEAADILYSDLCQMLTDAGKEGYNYWIASGYRSAKKQQKLVDEDVRIGMNQGLSYEDALEKTYEETMPAGYSEHQTGLALDILASSNLNMDISQENTAENKWMKEHCYEYGFILRYPRDKENITKISYEPWHFRYVGKEAAEYIRKNNLTLEEFYLKL